MNPRDEKGVALVTVLMISMVIMMISLFLSWQMRSQIRQAKQVKSYLQASVNLENLKQTAIFRISTQKFRQKGIKIDNKTEWHFDGTLIQNAMGSMKIQDTNGLLPLWGINFSRVRALLIANGIKQGDVKVFIDSLRDWIDEDDFKRISGAESWTYKEMGKEGPRNGFLQTIEEFRMVKGCSDNIWEILKTHTAESVSYYINPLNMDPDLFCSFFNADSAQKRRFEKLVSQGITDEGEYIRLFPEIDSMLDVSFFPSRRLVISIQGESEGIKTAGQSTVLFKEIEKTPYIVENNRYLSPEAFDAL